MVFRNPPSMAKEMIMTAMPMAIPATPILATVEEKDLPLVCWIRRAINKAIFTTKDGLQMWQVTN